jgi:glycosyltransferase involved in cell wall biosynthesis
VGFRSHILFIIENDTFPFDTRVWQEALVAKSLGHKVSVISPKLSVFKKSFEVIKGIEIHRHSGPGNIPGRLGFIIEYLNALFWELLLCIKIYLKSPFTIIHAANPPDHIFILALLFRCFGVKFVFDHHDLAPQLFLCKFGGKKNFIYHILLLMERMSCKTADVIVSANDSFKKIVQKVHGVPAEKIFVVRNDPSVDRFITVVKSSKKAENNGTVNVLYLGGIGTQDGVDILIKITNIAVNDLGLNNLKLNVIGDGDGLESAKRLSREFHLGTHINFAGYIFDRKIINEYFACADICVEPAPKNEVNNHSTFVKIMEYMVVGKPIIAFDLDETRFSAEGAAIFIEEGNLRAFAEAIQKLAVDDSLRAKLGQYGQQRVLTTLNWANSSKVLKKAYDYLNFYQ